MAKKSFARGLDSLLEPTAISKQERQEEKQAFLAETSEKIKKRGRPKGSHKEFTNTSEDGTLPGDIRATFILKKTTLEKIKATAFWGRMQIKQVIEEALEQYLKSKGEKYLQEALNAYNKRGNNERGS